MEYENPYLLLLRAECIIPSNLSNILTKDISREYKSSNSFLCKSSCFITEPLLLPYWPLTSALSLVLRNQSNNFFESLSKASSRSWRSMEDLLRHESSPKQLILFSLTTFVSRLPSTFNLARGSDVLSLFLIRGFTNRGRKKKLGKNCANKISYPNEKRKI